MNILKNMIKLNIIKIITVLVIIYIFIIPACAKDCLDYSRESKEPIMLIGKHPFFYGGTFINHFVNYQYINNNTIEIHDYMYNHTYQIGIQGWDEIRPDVYSDGIGTYYKLFTYKEPQRYWRKMI